ncbi:hypothetical protein ACFQ0M_30000 [Kitasatospora aburaviensis]
MQENQAPKSTCFCSESQVWMRIWFAGASTPAVSSTAARQASDHAAPPRRRAASNCTTAPTSASTTRAPTHLAASEATYE